MATTNTRKRSAAKKAETAAPTPEEVVQEQPAQPIVPKEVDPNQYVTVRNGFHGKLIYRSSRTGEKFVWGAFGDEQEMELRELRNAKNTSKKFFESNWFMFDEPWIVDYLGVRQYYRNAVPIDRFDDLFKMKAADLKRVLKEMSDGQKRSVAYRAKELIRDNEIDSLSVIHAIEEALNIELIER